jgi:sulfate transport system ATP-binding protein
VALARALAIEPRVLLLDEPFGALDAKVRRELRRWLRELHDRTGHTTVFVTHDQEEAMELADRVVVMSQGRIEQVGTPDEIYDRPGSPFVFSFIGESSALTVTVERGRVVYGGKPLRIGSDGATDGPGTLFFRPNAVDLVEHEKEAITGSVASVRRHGAARRVELDIGGRERIEIEAPPGFQGSLTGRLSVVPREWRIYPHAN